MTASILTKPLLGSVKKVLESDHNKKVVQIWLLRPGLRASIMLRVERAKKRRAPGTLALEKACQADRGQTPALLLLHLSDLDPHIGTGTSTPEMDGTWMSRLSWIARACVWWEGLARHG